MRVLLTGLAFMAVPLTAAHAEIVWNMPTAYNTSVLSTQIDYWFAEEIEKRTNGQLRIQLHDASSLYRMPEILHAVRSGQVQIGEIVLSSYSNEHSVFALENIPFLAVGVEEAQQLYHAQRPALSDIFSSQGLEMIFTVPFAGQGLFTRKEISSLSDVAGMKIRILSPIGTQLVEEIGGQALVTEAPDVPQAFLTGMVDAMISGSPAISMKPWEFSNYYYTVDVYHSKSAVIVNQSALAALPQEIRNVVLDVAKEAEDRGWSAMVEDDAKNLRLMEENGIMVMEETPELQEGLHAAGKRVLDKWRKTAGEQANVVIEAFLTRKQN